MYILIGRENPIKMAILEIPLLCLGPFRILTSVGGFLFGETMITQSELKQELYYDEYTGKFSWAIARTGRRKCVGWVDKKGYLNIEINGRNYKAHRLAWLYKKGYFPEGQIDHKNRIRLDNSWVNLREATPTCQSRNTKVRTDNLTGVKGIGLVACKVSNNLKYKVRITINGRRHVVGTFTDFVEAVAYRLAVEQCVDWAGCDTSSSSLNYMNKFLGRF